MRLESLFNGINDYRKIDISMLDYKVQRKEVAGTLAAAEQATSAALARAFPAYLNSLGLDNAQGRQLTLAENGPGAGQDLSAFDWLQVEGKRIARLDFDGYLRHLGRMKTPPAFDALDLSSGENQLFGNAEHDKRHFTAYSLMHSAEHAATPEGKKLLADAATVRLMNPMNYIGQNGSRVARHWRIRHGTKDSDTSLAIPAMLALALQNRGHAVDFALPWERPHSGDYDLDELFDWMDEMALRRAQ